MEWLEHLNIRIFASHAGNVRVLVHIFKTLLFVMINFLMMNDKFLNSLTISIQKIVSGIFDIESDKLKQTTK